MTLIEFLMNYIGASVLGFGVAILVHVAMILPFFVAVIVLMLTMRAKRALVTFIREERELWKCWK